MAYDQNGNFIPDDYQRLLDQLNQLGTKFDSVITDRNANYVKPQSDGTYSIPGGKNYYGFDVPDYQTVTKSDGTLGDNFKESLGQSAVSLRDFGNSYNANLDPRLKLGMNEAQMKLKDAAMSTGDMPEFAAMRQQQANRFRGDLSKADASRQGMLATQNANLAMRGGLNSGAAERMNGMSLRNAMMDRQSAYGQNRDANLNLDLQNAQSRTSLLRDVGNMQQGVDQANIGMLNNQQNKRLDTLGAVAGMENNQQASNVNRLAQDRYNMNLQRFGVFDKNMEAWAAEKTAQGQAAAGGGGGGGMCFITTACVDVMGMDDDCWILEKARMFRDTYMTATPDRAYQLASYYSMAPEITEKLDNNKNKVKILKSLFWKFIIPFCELVDAGKLEDARLKYISMMDKLKKELGE